jgi:hypothetical protein
VIAATRTAPSRAAAEGRRSDLLIGWLVSLFATRPSDRREFYHEKDGLTTSLAAGYRDPRLSDGEVVREGA